MLLALGPVAGAQSPDANWNLMGTDALNIVADCVGVEHFSVAESGDGCQSYSADLYENWDSLVAGSGDTDIEFYSTGADTDFFYFEWETRESWNYDTSGQSRQYQVELDVDASSEANRGDILLIWIPQITHLGNTWRLVDDGGDGKVQGFQDTNNDVGGPNPLTSDFDCSSICDGYKDDFKTTNDIFVRIINRSGKNVLQLAIRRTALGSPTTIHSRGWAAQTSVIPAGKFTWHDLQGSADLATNRFDACCSVGTVNWPESSSPEPRSIVKRAFQSDGTPIANGSTLPTGMPVKFLLYISNPGGVVSDVSLQDVLDPVFLYVGGSIRYDSSVAACAGATCTPGEEAAIFAAADGGTVGTDPVNGDVVSFTVVTLDVGNSSVANAQLNIPAGKVWAMVFAIRVQ